MTLKSLIKKTKHDAFRRIYIKRRGLDGDFEANWYRIPDSDITKFGSYGKGIDDVLLNFYSTNGLSFEVSNLQGNYSDITEITSIFYQKFAVQGTMVKVEAGYIDESGTEYPSSPTMFLGIISNDSSYSEDFKANFSCKQLSYVFENFPADEITGLGTTMTATEIIQAVRDYQDSNTVSFFQKYFSTGAWNIFSTTVRYNMATTTTLQSISIWELFQDLAVSENCYLYIGNDQTFNFVKNDSTTSTDFHFSGLGDEYPTWGFNIIGDMAVQENYRKVYNRIEIKYDTDSSLFVRSEPSRWGDSSSSFTYGVRKYEYENKFLQAGQVGSVASLIFDEYSFPKQECQFAAKFIPHLEVGDLVTLTYKPFVLESGAQWNRFLWNNITPPSGYVPAVWGGSSGYNIEIDNVEFKVINIEHDFDNFSSNFLLRESS